MKSLPQQAMVLIAVGNSSHLAPAAGRADVSRGRAQCLPSPVGLRHLRAGVPWWEKVQWAVVGTYGGVLLSPASYLGQ